MMQIQLPRERKVETVALLDVKTEESIDFLEEHKQRLFIAKGDAFDLINKVRPSTAVVSRLPFLEKVTNRGCSSSILNCQDSHGV